MERSLYDDLVLGEVMGDFKSVNPFKYGLKGYYDLTTDNLKGFNLDEGKPFIMYKKEALGKAEQSMVSRVIDGWIIDNKYFFKMFFPCQNFDRFVYGKYCYVDFKTSNRLSGLIPYSILKSDLIPSRGVDKTVEGYKFCELPSWIEV